VNLTWFTPILQLSVWKTGQFRNWQLLHHGVVISEPMNVSHNILRYAELLLVPCEQLFIKKCEIHCKVFHSEI
jgi:hypothetical protein